MSVLIKEMEMPKKCDDCGFCLLGDVDVRTLEMIRFCVILQRKVLKDEKHKDCPLVEVPTPHGRLIDADKIPMHKQLEACGNGKYKSILVAYENNIDVTPTVIESEE